MSKPIKRRKASKSFKTPDEYENFEDIIKELHSQVDTSTMRMSYLYDWVCPQGHIYDMELRLKIHRNLQCPYCAGQRVLISFNDVATTDPWVVGVWSKKNKFSPQEVTRASGKEVILHCPNGHEDAKPMRNYTLSNRGCGYCRGYKKKIGVNDLSSARPEMAAEYSSENLVPVSEVWATMSKLNAKTQVKWVCQNNIEHVWTCSVAKRLYKDTGCPYCSGYKADPGISDVATLYPHLVNEWSSKNSVTLREVSSQSCRRMLWICKYGHEWEALVFHRTNGSTCPVCFPSSSRAEMEIAELVTSIVGEDKVVLGNRKVLKGLELDIYIPSMNVAIEYNGVYWHTESMGKDVNYHFNKWKLCNDLGIRLISVWEDDWHDNTKAVKTLIRNMLTVNDTTSIDARQCDVRKISRVDAYGFFSKNDIQPTTLGSIHYGLFHNKELVSVGTFERKQGGGNDYCLVRFCSLKTINGEIRAIVRCFFRENDVDKLEAIVENDTGQGDYYLSAGFTKREGHSPDYKYVYKDKRYDKEIFDKKRFREDEKLAWDGNMDEHQLAELNSIERIWDCGKTRFSINRQDLSSGHY